MIFGRFHITAVGCDKHPTRRRSICLNPRRSCGYWPRAAWCRPSTFMRVWVIRSNRTGGNRKSSIKYTCGRSKTATATGLEIWTVSIVHYIFTSPGDHCTREYFQGDFRHSCYWLVVFVRSFLVFFVLLSTHTYVSIL